MVLSVEARSAFLNLHLFETKGRAFSQAHLARDQMHTSSFVYGPLDSLYALAEAGTQGLALFQLRQKPREGNVALKHNLYLGATVAGPTGPIVARALQVRRLNDQGYPSSRTPFPNPSADRSLLHIPGFGLVSYHTLRTTADYGSYVLVAEANEHGIDAGTRLAGPFKTVLEGAAVLRLVENAAFQFIDEPLVLNRKPVLKFQFEPEKVITVEQVDIDPPVEVGDKRNKFLEPDFVTQYEVRVSGAPELNADIPQKNVFKVNELSKAIDPRAVGGLVTKIGRGFGMNEHKSGHYQVTNWHGGVLILDTRAAMAFIPRSPLVTNPKDINDGLQFDQARLLMIAD